MDKVVQGLLCERLAFRWLRESEVAIKGRQLASCCAFREDLSDVLLHLCCKNRNCWCSDSRRCAPIARRLCGPRRFRSTRICVDPSGYPCKSYRPDKYHEEHDNLEPLALPKSWDLQLLEKIPEQDQKRTECQPTNASDLPHCSKEFRIHVSRFSSLLPNAGAHLLPEAGAERTLEAVRCSAMLECVDRLHA